MSLPGTPHTARASLLFTYGADGQTCMNTFYARDNSDAMFADPSGTLAAWQGAATLDLVPHLFPSVSLTGMVFEDVRTFPFGGIQRGISPVPGTKSGAVAKLPSHVCLAIKKNTGNLGRSGRGRWYWPLGDVAALSGTNDTVLAGYITEIEAALAAFADHIRFGSVPAEFGIVSYRHGGAPRTAGLFQSVISFSITDAIVDSQRRRLTNRGR